MQMSGIFLQGFGFQNALFGLVSYNDPLKFLTSPEALLGSLNRMILEMAPEW